MQNQRPAHRHTAPHVPNANGAPTMGGELDQWNGPSRGYSDSARVGESTSSMHDNATSYTHAWHLENTLWSEFMHEEPVEMEDHEQSMLHGTSQNLPNGGSVDNYSYPRAHDSLIFSEDSFTPAQASPYGPAPTLEFFWGPQPSTGMSHGYHTMAYGQHTGARLDFRPATFDEGSRSNDPRWAVRGDSQSRPSNAIPSVLPVGADTQNWTIRQKKYSGNKGQHSPSTTLLPLMMVGVAAWEAIDPELLAQALYDPLGSGFPEDPSRKGRKLTVRCAFIGCGQRVWQNENPKQVHEYASRHQSSKTVEVVWRRCGKPLRKDSESIPLMRATLVEMVALQLQKFMGELEAQNSPLTFRGHKVDFNHLRIVNLYRPTPASVQPTLEILTEYRHLYPIDGGAL